MILVMGLLLAALPAGAGQEMDVDGVLHIRNSDTPANGVQDLELEELWRIGGEDDEDVLLGIISRVLIDDQNNIYLLDGQLSQVQVFSADGEYLNTIGRAGSGPGEITNPGDFVFMPDGTLGLVQIFPGKIVKLDMEGTPAGDFNPITGEATAGGFLALVNCRGAGGNLVLSGLQIAYNSETQSMDRNHFVRSYGMDGQMVAEYLTKLVHWNFNENFKLTELDNDFIWWRMDVGPEGKLVVCEPRYGYALSVYSPDGTLERVIDREYESWTRNEAVFKRWETIMAAQAGQLPPGTPTEAEKMEQDVTDLRVARDGSIWVLPSRQMYEPDPGTFATYDVFTPSGDFDRQVRVSCEGSSSTDRLFFAGGDRLFQVKGFWDAVLSASGGPASDDEEEPEPMEVICYLIK